MITAFDSHLLLHLPCNALAENGHLLDGSLYAAHPALPAGVEMKPDPVKGRALEFSPDALGMETRLPWLPLIALTACFWIRPADEDDAPVSATLLEIPPPPGDVDMKTPVVSVRLLAGGTLWFIVGHLDAGSLTFPVASTAKWHHVALIWDGLTKSVRIQLDGVPVPPDTIIDASGQTVPPPAVPGMLLPPQDKPPLFIGVSADGSRPFTSGRMAHLRIYARALTEAEIKAVLHDEAAGAALPFDHHHPLSFRLADAHGFPAIAIVDTASHGRDLNLVLGNTGPFAIEFLRAETAEGNPERVGEIRPSPGDHHLEVVFRPGTLTLEDARRIAPTDTDWQLQCLANEDRTLSLLLKRPAGLIIPPGGVLTVSLAHVKAAAPGGSRPTQAELRYRHLHYLDEEATLQGHRLAHLEVVNERGLAGAPFAVGFIGSHTVLNDGHTRNTLVLYLGNPSLKPLPLHSSDPLAKPRIFLRFDCAQEEEPDTPWSLGHVDEVTGIEVAPQDPGWTVHRDEQAPAPLWILEPPRGLKEIGRNTWINFTLYPLITAAPSGFTALRLRYQNIPGYRDGEIVVPIEKASRFFRQQPIPGHSSASAAAPGGSSGTVPRTVHAFADSVVIGRNLARSKADDEPAAPPFPEENFLLVEGLVDIGLGSDPDALPWHALHVGGAAKFEGSVSDRHGLIIPIGTIVMWSDFRGQPIPPGWVLCDGREVTIPADVEKSANARDPGLPLKTFKVPDLRDRFIIGSGQSHSTGDTGGEAQFTLKVEHMPSHRHGGTTKPAALYPNAGGVIYSNSAGSLVFEKPDSGRLSYGSHSHELETDDTGGGEAHENRPPFHALAFIMKID